LISLYQTGSTEDDNGSGYASGIINFTTRNGDALKVIQAYKGMTYYAGEFDEFMSTLESYAEEESGSTEGLDGYCDAWKTAANNTEFWNAQSSVVYNDYEQPTFTYINQIGIKYSVTHAALYDTAIVDGLGSSSSSLGGMFKATNKAFTEDVNGASGNNVTINGKYHVDEYVWLAKFLDIRESKSSSKNVEAYKSMLESDGSVKDWSSGVTVKGPDGDDVTIKCNYISSSD
ncbi:hypothetical protein LPJ70_004084, partial [Coemansia sp. RSA 2708]